MFRRLASGLLMTLAAGSSVQAGVVTVWGDEIMGSIKIKANNFYNSLAGHSSSIAAGELNTVNLDTTDLLWITTPRDDYTAAELNTMAGFIAAGGRIAFMGEHDSVAHDANTRINTALSFLGSTIIINYAALDANIRTASVADGQILAHPLTAGVSTYEYGWFAPLTISGTAQALMTGEEPYNSKPGIMMAYQNIGAGTVFVIADQSMWANEPTSWPGGFDNARMFENLLIGTTAINAPTSNPVFVTNVNSLTPTINWTYADIQGDVQQKYEVEVWTGPSGTGTKMWDPPIGTGAISSIVYAGTALTGAVVYYARVRASDASGWGNFSEISFTVTNANMSPVADAGPDLTVFAGAGCNATVTLNGTGSSDPDGGAIVSYTWHLPSNENPAGAKTDVTMLIGTHQFILTVVDDEGTDDKDTVIITVANRIPTLGALSDTTIDEGERLTLRFTASDSAGIVPRLAASGLPTGAVFVDSGNGTALFSWNTGSNSHGVYAVTITAGGNPAAYCLDSVKQSFTITVRDADCTLKFLPTGDTTAPENQELALTVRTRYCDGDVPEIKAISIPPGSTLKDNGNGSATLEWTPDSIDSGDHGVVFEAADNHTAVRDTVLIHITDVTTPQLPGQLTGGHYSDENADGMVDAVYLQFNKGVPIDSMTVSLDWPGAGVPHMGTLAGAGLSYGTDRAAVRVTIPAASQRANGIKTAGRMSALVQFTAFVNDKQSTDVIDNAAPVIDSAIYRIGDQPSADTLIMWFSERVRLGTGAAPFTLFSGAATPYSPSMELRSLQDNHAIFIVNGSEGFTGPESGDSIFISPVSAVGDSLTWQNNPANRRVILNREPGAVITIVPISSSGENPMDISGIKGQFGIKQNSGKIIAIDTKHPFDTLKRNGEPVIDEKDGKPAFGTAMIYDAVGNLVKADLFIKKAAVDRVYYIFWDGTNRNHRRVARGGYLTGIAFTIDKDQGAESKKFIIRWH